MAATNASHRHSRILQYWVDVACGVNYFHITNGPDLRSKLKSVENATVIRLLIHNCNYKCLHRVATFIKSVSPWLWVPASRAILRFSETSTAVESEKWRFPRHGTVRKRYGILIGWIGGIDIYYYEDPSKGVQILLSHWLKMLIGYGGERSPDWIKVKWWRGIG